LRVSRRELLEIGGIGLWGLSLPRLLRASAIEQDRLMAPRADACILIFLNGGPSHLDMWDMKPEAPAEVRGEFAPIATSIPGVQFCELLPRMARQMHHFTLVRSMHHSVNNAHAAAVYVGLTGHDRGDATVAIGAGPHDYPAIGSVMGLCRPPETPVVPFVSLPSVTAEGRGGPPQPGFFGGWLGRNHDPLFVLRDPNASDFGVPELTLTSEVPAARLDARRRLVEHISGPLESLGGIAPFQEMDKFQEKAFDLLTAPATRRAFQLEQEATAVRDSYGRNIYGQSVLLARRLIEAGTRVACISWAPDANATWDTHGQNFKKLKQELLPQLDAAVSSLIQDLVDRRMLDRTLVVVMGEFGRTPKINAAAGRDHWNFFYSLLLAGGGMKSGFVYGASDKIGARPANIPLLPAEIIATVYHCLGIPHQYELHDRLNRPFQLVPWGNPVLDLLA
jgi:hypothetical protein